MKSSHLEKITERFVYFGGIRKNQPQGIGIRFMRNTCIEIGRFEKGLIEGHGRMIFGNKHIFIGQFYQGVMDKKGYFYNGENKSWFLFNEGARFGRPNSRFGDQTQKSGESGYLFGSQTRNLQQISLISAKGETFAAGSSHAK